jgi:hypothetical protein
MRERKNNKFFFFFLNKCKFIDNSRLEFSSVSGDILACEGRGVASSSFSAEMSTRTV